MSSTSVAASPFAEGVLSAEHEAQLVAIRTCLTTWLSIMDDCRNKVAGSPERLDAAMKNLIDLQVAEPYAFSPSSQYPFRKTLLSCTKCYWLALVASLTAQAKEEMGKRLELVPPFGERVPQFDGKKCVEKPGELSAREYEGLMRTIHLVSIGMVSKDVGKSWRELGEVGVQTWEERD